MLDGLAEIIPAGELTAVVNTGDDFVHWGLTICPDLDTVMYNLAGLSDPGQGWGIVGDTFTAYERMSRISGPQWFQLGDQDLATHIYRTKAMADGATLSQATSQLMQGNGIDHRILPMSDDWRQTVFLMTDGRELLFNEWFVRERTPRGIESIGYQGDSQPAPAVVPAVEAADLVIIGPSNPYVSIDTILSLDGVRDAVSHKPVVAVSPIVGGQAVKGPLAWMLPLLDRRDPSPAAIVDHYGGIVDAIVVETGDSAGLGVPTLESATIMGNRDDRVRLAGEIMNWAGQLV